MEVDNKIGREISKETNSLAVFSDRRHVSTNLHPLFSLSLSLSLCLSLFPGGPAGLTPELKSALDDFVTKHRVVAFIKGTKDFPQCGFSNTVVQILSSAGVPFETVDVLADERLRSSLKEYSVSFFFLFFRLFLRFGKRHLCCFFVRRIESFFVLGVAANSGSENKKRGGEKKNLLFFSFSFSRLQKKKKKKAWPTFPQVYIAGSFFGGCDIMIEAYQSGELVEVLETALSE